MTDQEVRCTSCLKIINVKIYSAGLSDIIPFTCDRDSTVFALSTQDATIQSILGGYPSSGWNSSDYKKIEARLIPCPCGGTFKRGNLPKCPNCGVPLRVEGLGRSEFVVVARMIDGEKDNPWQGLQRSNSASSFHRTDKSSSLLRSFWDFSTICVDPFILSPRTNKIT